MIRSSSEEAAVAFVFVGGGLLVLCEFALELDHFSPSCQVIVAFELELKLGLFINFGLTLEEACFPGSDTPRLPYCSASRAFPFLDVVGEVPVV